MFTCTTRLVLSALSFLFIAATTLAQAQLPCTPGCNDCKNGTCFSCRGSTYLDSGMCKMCKQSCTACSDWDTCTACSTGFWAQTTTSGGNSTTTCNVCPRGCTACFNSTSCQGCATGFTPDQNGVCSECKGSYCSSCSGSNLKQCLGCLDTTASPDKDGDCPNPKPNKTEIAILVILIVCMVVLIS